MFNSSILSNSVAPHLTTSACQDRAIRLKNPRWTGTQMRDKCDCEGTSVDEESFASTGLSPRSMREFLGASCNQTVIHVEIDGDGNVRVWAM